MFGQEKPGVDSVFTPSGQRFFLFSRLREILKNAVGR